MKSLDFFPKYVYDKQESPYMCFFRFLYVENRENRTILQRKAGISAGKSVIYFTEKNSEKQGGRDQEGSGGKYVWKFVVDGRKGAGLSMEKAGSYSE